MEDPRHQKSFVFDNATVHLNSVLMSCLKYIDEKKEVLPVPVAIHPRIKWTITELLLNGTKHAGTSESNLILKLSEKNLVIQKEDSGNPLRLKVRRPAEELLWPIRNSLLQQEFEIYHNGNDSLRVYTESNDTAIFRVTELDEFEMSQMLVNTAEHFGLMIITKSSDHFSYLYDRPTKRNIFTVAFEYSE
jgi:hypothetical protein